MSKNLTLIKGHIENMPFSIGVLNGLLDQINQSQCYQELKSRQDESFPVKCYNAL